MSVQNYLNYGLLEQNICYRRSGAISENIAALFNSADKKLKVLDKLMLNVKEKNAELYTMYESAKVIIDKASSHKSAATTNANSSEAAASATAAVK